MIQRGRQCQWLPVEHRTLAPVGRAWWNTQACWEVRKEDASDTVARRPILIQFVSGKLSDFSIFFWDKSIVTNNLSFVWVSFFWGYCPFWGRNRNVSVSNVCLNPPSWEGWLITSLVREDSNLASPSGLELLRVILFYIWVYLCALAPQWDLNLRCLVLLPPQTAPYVLQIDVVPPESHHKFSAHALSLGFWALRRQTPWVRSLSAAQPWAHPCGSPSNWSFDSLPKWSFRCGSPRYFPPNILGVTEHSSVPGHLRLLNSAF